VHEEPAYAAALSGIEKSNRGSSSLSSALRGETLLKMGKAKLIATREIMIEFVF